MASFISTYIAWHHIILHVISYLNVYSMSSYHSYRHQVSQRIQHGIISFVHIINYLNVYGMASYHSTCHQLSQRIQHVIISIRTCHQLSQRIQHVIISWCIRWDSWCHVRMILWHAVYVEIADDMYEWYEDMLYTLIADYMYEWYDDMLYTLR